VFLLAQLPYARVSQLFPEFGSRRPRGREHAWNTWRRGQAALQRARGESAALRNLANAARVLEGNPA